MTKKYTKRQYEKDLAANDAEKALNDAFLESFNLRLENGEQLDQELSDNWNAAYDVGYDIEDERGDIERKWNTRNWTWQDWSEYDLVSQNID